MTVYKLVSKQIGYVLQMYGVALKRGLPRKAAVYAVACSGAEASLYNWENSGSSMHIGRAEGRPLNFQEREVAKRSRGLGDGVPPWGDNLDSMGLFAQRPMSGWGPPEFIMVPENSINSFYNHLVAVRGWENMDTATVIKRVQGYHSDVYTAWLETAEAYVPTQPSTDDWFHKWFGDN